MDLRKLPNLGALKAFEAAARLKSFSRAAQELYVTHSAISHQIRSLEAELGIVLFKREGKRIDLTDRGHRYAEQVRAALINLASATESIRSGDRDRRLVISVLPSFASRWLTPRIGRFIDLYPELDVELQSTHTLTDFNRDEVDVVLRFGDGDYPGVFVELLLDEAFFPVCAPTFNNGNLPKTPTDLANATLLRNDFEMWRCWFEAAGLDASSEPRRGVLYQDASHLIQAAAEGQGVALVRRSLAMQEIADGRLVRLFDVDAPSPWAYWFMCPRPLVETFRVRVLREWLHQEVIGFQAMYEPSA
ncbi:DNA-binding transcriptional activator GcvA [Caballeronia calidae]|uniref:DNA-binding transcriptional activator GcvA n=1 Tax=Caballeronia calidae TaxID=1777139 RepID=A0A158EEI3_9BURK|nr:transcriptional regulator GcvA [Caballeronia calidae]SAL05312.1 DNA-binding transcriptional activator GcvA [Caballeronia calidae]